MRKKLRIPALVLAILLCACFNTAFAASTDNAGAALRIAAGDTIVFGRYEQDGDIGNGPEPIQWLVLDMRGENDAAGAGVLLISQYELACREFHDRDEPVTWETSSLRAWLNGEFCSAAFTEQEKAFIARTHISTTGNYDEYIESGKRKKENNPGGNDTEDRVFILSYEEATKYFYFGTTNEYPAMGYRLTAPSYAAFIDACVNYFSAAAEELHTGTEYDMLVKALPQLTLREGTWEIDLPTLDEYAAFWSGTHTVGDYGPEIFWWLRTPGYEEDGFCSVYKDGSISDSGDPGSSPYFIRPTLWLSAAAFADAEIAVKAMPIPPNAQIDDALTGTWKTESENGQIAYFKFDADGYHMAIAVSMNGSYEVYPAIFEADNGKLRVMQIGYRGEESVVDYQLMSPDVLKLTGENAPGVLTRVDDSEFPLAREDEAVLEIK